MCLAVVMLLFSISGHASAYFEDGHLIRAVYQAGGSYEVLTDLGPFNTTTLYTGPAVSYVDNLFSLPGGNTFPTVLDANGTDITWSTLQVSYFIKDSANQRIWVSGPASGSQVNGNRQFGAFEGAANLIMAGAGATNPQVIQAQGGEQSYVTLMDNGNPADSAGSFTAFLPNQDGEENLGMLATASHVNQDLYYYENPDVASAGKLIAHISTYAYGYTVIDGDFTAGSSHLEISVPSTATAGAALPGVVVAVDADGYIDTTYNDALDFSSTDGHAALPKTGAVKIKNGIATFKYTMETTGFATITAKGEATTGAATGTSNDMLVLPAAPKGITVVPQGLTPGDKGVYTGATTMVSVFFHGTVVDKYNNVVTNFNGPVGLAISDKATGAAVLPANVTASDGTFSFSAKIATGAKAQTITANGSVAVGTKTVTFKGTAKVLADWAPVDHLTITGLADVTRATGKAGSTSGTVTAYDSSNSVTQIADTVTLSSSPADGVTFDKTSYTLSKGIAKFKVTFASTATADTYTITAHDSATGASATDGTGTVVLK